jgi:hypothetical protein
MARKKKSSQSNAAMPSSGSDRISTDISNAENGFIVGISGETGGKKPSYFSKRFIAASRPEAMRIAATHFSGAMKKAKGKKAGRKKSVKR